MVKVAWGTGGFLHHELHESACSGDTALRVPPDRPGYAPQAQKGSEQNDEKGSRKRVR